MNNKLTLSEEALSLDDVISYLPNNCDGELTLKIQKKNSKYGILSFEFKNETSELIKNVKVFDKEGKEVII